MNNASIELRSGSLRPFVVRDARGTRTYTTAPAALQRVRDLEREGLRFGRAERECLAAMASVTVH